MPDISSRENPYNVTQASRIYFLPNLMTAGNLFCGFVAVIKCIQARLLTDAGEYALRYEGLTWSQLYTQAVWFILAAVIFDSLDGRLARLGGRTSLFGAEFDSLADVVSFGVAPALMVFFLILHPTDDYAWFRELGWAVAFVYLLCAAVRLARFNVITNPLLHGDKADTDKDFLGLPVPAAAGTIASLVLFLLELSDNVRSLQRWALALPFLLVLISVLMVSTIRFPSFKQIDWQTQTRFRTFLLVLLGALVVWKLGGLGIFLLFLSYIAYALGRQGRRTWQAWRTRVVRRQAVSSGAKRSQQLSGSE